MRVAQHMPRTQLAVRGRGGRRRRAHRCWRHGEDRPRRPCGRLPGACRHHDRGRCDRRCARSRAPGRRRHGRTHGASGRDPHARRRPAEPRDHPSHRARCR
eukprot:Amastigsp_a510841_157.p6 type:complete len:101 gc:universal Amastigsp_a510841_157:915-613(-)